MHLTNAAGTAKTFDEAKAILETNSPAVVLGSFTLKKRPGNAGSVDYFGDNFSLNVRGIPSPSLSDWIILIQKVVDFARKVRKSVCVSVASFEPLEYGVLANAAFKAGADRVELNFGCPNMREGGAFAPIISYRPLWVADALRGLEEFSELNKREIWVKVSPIFDDVLFNELVKVLKASKKIEGVVAVNTLPQCIVLDSSGAPVLTPGLGFGGMSGPALKPIALAQVVKWSREGFRVIGVGGISSGMDVRDYWKCGAISCQVNTVIQKEGTSAIDRILKEYQSYPW